MARMTFEVPEPARSLLAAGRLAEAEGTLRAALQANGNDLGALYGLAQLAMAVSKPAVAVQLLSQARSLAPHSGGVVIALARALSAQRRWSAAIAELDGAAGTLVGAERHAALLELSRHLHRRARFTEALAVLDAINSPEADVEAEREAILRDQKKTCVAVDFADFWPGYGLDTFEKQFWFLLSDYFLYEENEKPQVTFFSCFTSFKDRLPDGRMIVTMPDKRATKGVSVFITGENVEPIMEYCDYAITFSASVCHERHMRIPLWVYDVPLKLGVTPADLHKRDWDIDRLVREKTRFCGFVQSHSAPTRNELVKLISGYKRVDCAGRCLNNTNAPLGGGSAGKVAFLKECRFGIGFENESWPGYTTEKLVEVMVARSLPIYWGDPLIHFDFNPASFINILAFPNAREALKWIAAVDSDDRLYRRLLAEPWFKDDVPPGCATVYEMRKFFDGIFAAAREAESRA